MNDYDAEFPNLKYLLGYFHQGWSRNYDWSKRETDFEAAVRYFKVDNGLAATSGAINDLERLLKLPLAEKDLEEIIDDFTTSGYSPLETHRKFLERLLIILKEPFEQTKQAFIPRYIG